MSETTLESTEGLHNAVRAFGQHFNYDVTFMEEMLDASPEAFIAFYDAARPLTRFQKEAPTELLAIARIAATRAQDCGPCLELVMKMSREADVPADIVRGAARGGEGLSPEHHDVHDFAQSVASGLPVSAPLRERLEARLGRAVMAELAVATVGGTVYPTLKRALGHHTSCSLMPEVVA